MYRAVDDNVLEEIKLKIEREKAKLARLQTVESKQSKTEATQPGELSY